MSLKRVSILVFFAGLAAGCGTPPKVSVWSLCERPPGWADIAGRTPDIQARHCHLEVREDCALLDPTRFEGDLDAAVDVAIAGGEPNGFAGLFVKDGNASERPFFGACVRGTGEVRVFRSSDPQTPLGGRGWEPSLEEAPTGFFRLAVSVAGGEVRFFLDGRALGAIPLESSDASAQRAFAVGIVNRGAASRWKNFAAGESGRSGRFRPEAHASWGGPEDARELLERAREEAKRFSARPSRSSVYPVAASLDQALRILKEIGDESLVRKAEELAGQMLEKMAEGADRIGETAFVRAAFARLLASPAAGAARTAVRYLQRAEEAERRGQTAEAFCLYKAAELEGAGPESAAAAKALEGSLRPLSLEVAIGGETRQPLFDVKLEVWKVLRSLYGSAPQGDGEGLRVEISTLGSARDVETSEGSRTVAVYARGGEKLSKLAEEADRLARSIAEGLSDAQARMSILRASRRTGGIVRSGETQEVTLGGRRYELLVGDARRLEADERRLNELKKAIAEEEERHSVRHETIAAKVQTISIAYEFSLSAYLGSRRVVHVPKERVYRGAEQYEHPADPRRGIPASRFRPERIEETIDAVRRAAMETVRAAVSPENLFAALPRAEQLAFAVRYARAAKTEEARGFLEWALEEFLGLRGSLRRRVAIACSE